MGGASTDVVCSRPVCWKQIWAVVCSSTTKIKKIAYYDNLRCLKRVGAHTTLNYTHFVACARSCICSWGVDPPPASPCTPPRAATLHELAATDVDHEGARNSPPDVCMAQVVSPLLGGKACSCVHTYECVGPRSASRTSCRMFPICEELESW